ncbi:alpha/beta fold hydrolase [Achromobacter aloeverae]
MSTPAIDTVPPAQGQDKFVRLNGLRFHYVEWGRADAPAIVMLHGLRSYAMTFEPLAGRLSDRFRIIALDQRGRGLTDWDPERNYYTDQYVSDLAALADALGLRRFHLLGHSLGGINALAYARDRQDRLLSLVIEDYGPGAEKNGAGQERIRRELARTPMRFPGWSEARAFWRGARPDISEQALQSRLVHSLKEEGDAIVWRHDQEGIAAARLAPAPGRAVPDFWPAVAALACPTLLIRGARSDYLSSDIAARMVRENPRIVLREIERAGHYVHDDNAPDFERAVQGFYDALPAEV